MKKRWTLMALAPCLAPAMVQEKELHAGEVGYLIANLQTLGDVKVGDRVLFGKWGGTEVKIDGEDLLIMKESDIMGILS